MVIGMFTCCTHVHMKVLNCGCINRVALDTEVYISGDVCMESILVYCFHCVLISFVGMGCNEIFCRYTNNATCSSTRYVYERTYVCHRLCRSNVNFFLRFMRTYGTCMHHVHSCHYIFASLPPLSLIIPIYISHPIR